MNGKIYLWIAKFAFNGLYNYIDKNGDGKLDKKELESLSRMGRNLSRKLTKHL